MTRRSFLAPGASVLQWAVVMNIALVSCAAIPNLEPDDQLLRQELEARKIRTHVVNWRAPAMWSHYDLVLIRSPWDYIDHRDEFVQWAHHVSRGVELSNPAALMEWNTHKQYLIELKARGVPTIPTELLRARTEVSLRAMMVRHDWHDIVIKPAVASGSKDTLRFSREEVDAAQAHLDALVARQDVLIQPFVAAIQSQGEVSLVFFRGAFSHAVRKKPKTGDFRVQVQYGGQYDATTPEPQELETAMIAMDQLPEPPFYARVDMVWDGAHEQPLVMEVELIEPVLFFGYAPQGAKPFAMAIEQRLRRNHARKHNAQPK
jgi:glutathione synthase/RimK-type ligase-like ATP-grasp enzyme